MENEPDSSTEVDEQDEEEIVEGIDEELVATQHEKMDVLALPIRA